MASSAIDRIVELLGDDRALLAHQSSTIARERLHLPGSDYVDRVMLASDRPIPVLRSLQQLLDHGRLAKTGYLSILPVDQGVEHSAGASFAPNPGYFDPANLAELALEGGCNALASTLGALGIVARRYAHKIPLILKLNHNELLSLPAEHDQVMFGSVTQARDLGAVGVGATVYWGSPQSRRQLSEVSAAFRLAHELGMVTVLWCYLRNPRFVADQDYQFAADLTSQANHLGVTLGADIIKQKLPENNGGYPALGFGKTHPKVYSELTSPNPVDLCRYQVAGCYLGRAGMISSGGASGDDDLREAVRTAVINKRAGGMGVIAGRKALQRPLAAGIELLHAIQDVYLCPQVTVA